jgi:hypothetical protein
MWIPPRGPPTSTFGSAGLGSTIGRRTTTGVGSAGWLQPNMIMHAPPMTALRDKRNAFIMERSE